MLNLMNPGPISKQQLSTSVTLELIFSDPKTFSLREGLREIQIHLCAKKQPSCLDFFPMWAELRLDAHTLFLVLKIQIFLSSPFGTQPVDTMGHCPLI